MLEIFNQLEPFFRDNYRRLGVREYAKLRHISPPSASILLKQFSQEHLLTQEKERTYLFFSANKENNPFIELSRIYWYLQFKKDFIPYLEHHLIHPLIVLFGSFYKAEYKK